MTTARELYTALQQKAGFEVVEVSEGPKQLRIIGRVHTNYVSQWKLAMHHLLTKEQESAWKVDISKKYFLRNDNVFYGWRLIIQAENVPAHYAGIIQALQITSGGNEVTEVPLIGASSNRNTRTNVGPIGKVPLGSAAPLREGR